MNKPNLIESVTPHSGHYSFKRDLHLNLWLAVAVLVYLADLFALKHSPGWSPIVRALVAMAPLVPGLLYVRSWLRFIRGLDELQQRIQTEAFLFAALGTTIVGTALNILIASGVDVGVLFQHGLGLGGAFLTMFTLWLVGGAIANCRYK